MTRALTTPGSGARWRPAPLAWTVMALGLGPVACRGQGTAWIADGALGALGVRAEIVETSYPVAGHRLEDAWRSLRSQGPPGTGRGRAHGLTTYDLVPRWHPVREPDGCVVREARVDASIVIHLPSWAGARQAPLDDTSRWDDFLADLRRHEHAHRDLTLQTATALTVALRGTRAASCPRLVRLVAGAIRRAGTRLEREHARLDSAYRLRVHE